MTYWWHREPDTGWYRHPTKLAALDAAKTNLGIWAEHAADEGWGDGIELLSVWRTESLPPENPYDDWIKENGVEVACATECYRQTRPEPPGDLEGDALEAWRQDNWPVMWDFEAIVDYELREITNSPPA